MKPVDSKFANKYLPTDKYVPDTARPVIVFTKIDSYDDYDLGIYKADEGHWYHLNSGMIIFPDYWREIPKI